MLTIEIRVEAREATGLAASDSLSFTHAERRDSSRPSPVCVYCYQDGESKSTLSPFKQGTRCIAPPLSMGVTEKVFFAYGGTF